MSIVKDRRGRLLAGAVAAVVCVSCVTRSRGGGEQHYLVDSDERVRLDLNHPDVKPIFQQPRRYPFTVAIAPLYVEWSDGGEREGESTIHPEALNTPLPGDDPRQQTQASVWPQGVDADEERLILAAMSEAAVPQEGAGRTRPRAAEGPPATPDGAPPPPAEAPPPPGAPDEGFIPEDTLEPIDEPTDDPEGSPPPSEPAAPVSEPAAPPASEPAPPPASEPAPPPADEGFIPEDSLEPTDETAPAPAAEPAAPAEPERKPRRISRSRLEAWLTAAACPPDGPTSMFADAAGVSTLVLAAPAEWVEAAPKRAVRRKLIASYASSDGKGRLVTDWAPRAEFLPKSLEEPGAAQPDPKEHLEKWVPDVGALERVEAVELGGAPTLEGDAVLDMATGELVRVWVVVMDDRVFTIELTASDAASLEALSSHVKSSAKVEGRPYDPTPPAAAADGAADGGERRAQDEARAREIDELEGKNFAIGETGFQDRMTALLEQFGMFERVERLKFVTDAQRRDPTELFPQADDAGADFMLVARLRRNKVSYTGVNGNWAIDFGLWLLFYWPSEFWPGVKSEEYRSDVELVLEIYDVRSRERLWSTPYHDEETIPVSQPERGWFPWSVLLMRGTLVTEGTFERFLSNAGYLVRPRTWLEIEYQILRDLWSQVGFKGILDRKIPPTFEDRVNASVAPRRKALVVGVGRYGEKARPVLEALARARGETEQAVREAYGDESLSIGMRPYGETDAQRLHEFLVRDASFDMAEARLLAGPAASRVRVKAALRLVAKARRPDPVIIYMNGHTVVADDPEQPGDELKKFFLPYDADLEGLERLRAEPATRARAEAILAHLERTAISFEWIAETLNQASIEDHRYIMSREVLMVFDCAFPGPLGLRYAPAHEALIAGGGQPDVGGGAPLRRPGVGEDTTEGPIDGPANPPTPPVDERTPPVEAPTPPVEEPTPPVEEPTPPPAVEPTPGPEPTPVPEQTVPEPTPAPATDSPATDPPATDPPATEPPATDRKPRRVSQRRVQGTTVLAQAEGEVAQAQLTTHFLEDLARRPGRKVVVTVRWNERPLDVVPQKAGGFVYHFLRGARDRDRVPGHELAAGPLRLVVESGALLDYVRARVEDESRTLNRPQSIMSLGDNEDFPVIVIKRDQ